MGSEIFISYRRDSSAGYARALHGALRERFGEQQLFMDVDTIAPGIDFVKRIREAVGQCKVLIAVIGEDWLETRNEHGQRRLDDARDYVRIEIAGALGRDLPVIRVLAKRHCFGMLGTVLIVGFALGANPKLRRSIGSTTELQR